MTIKKKSTVRKRPGQVRMAPRGVWQRSQRTPVGLAQASDERQDERDGGAFGVVVLCGWKADCKSLVAWRSYWRREGRLRVSPLRETVKLSRSGRNDSFRGESVDLFVRWLITSTPCLGAFVAAEARSILRRRGSRLARC